MIDRQAAIAHLTALGYKDGETVYLRFFYPSDNPLKGGDKGRKLQGQSSNLPWDKIENLQAEGRGSYFVVNGLGDVDNAVTTGRAIFIEHDALEKNIQQKLWQAFGLPEPTIQVDTGGKSIHSYWVFHEPIPIKQWYELQIDLLEYVDGDRTIKNPSRVMRLAGCINPSTGKQSTIVSESLKRYSYEELREVVPIKEPPENTNTWREFERNFKLPISETIPLEVVLSRVNRALLENGSPEGARNNGGAALARDLIGAANYLRDIGQSYDGNTHDLLTQYCARCTPTLSSGECDDIYKSAEKSNPQPCLSAEPIANCIKAWSWKQQSTRSTSPMVQSPQRTNSANVEGREELEEETARELGELLALEDLDKPELFSDRLIDPLRNLAKRLNLPVEAYVYSLLPILGSVANVLTRLEIDPATNFYVYTIVWLGLVGESGSKKSPILRALMQPLSKMQAESEEDYQGELADYSRTKREYEAMPKNERADVSEPIEPKPAEFYVSDFTMESLAEVIRNQQQQGLLVHTDELAAFIRSMDAYRGGRGSDRQHWLAFYDGGALKVNRKSTGRVYAPRTAISVLGGIQPTTIQQILLRDDFIEDGLWSRFAWVRIPLAITPGIDNGTTYDLSDLLESLYRSIRTLPPATYRLSKKAVNVWNRWHYQIERLVLEEPSGLLRATYPKARERAARIALIAHIANALLEGQPVAPEISAETLLTAIQASRWLMGQTRLLYAEIGTSTDPEVARILKFVQRFGGNENWISAKQVRDWWAAKAKPNFEQCRSFMARVVRLGYAIANGEPQDSSKFQIQIPSSCSQSSHKTLGIPPNKDSSSDYKIVKSVVTVVTPEIDKGESDNLNGERSDYSDYQNDYKVVNPEIQQGQVFEEKVTTLTTNHGDGTFDGENEVIDQLPEDESSSPLERDKKSDYSDYQNDYKVVNPEIQQGQVFEEKVTTLTTNHGEGTFDSEKNNAGDAAVEVIDCDEF